MRQASTVHINSIHFIHLCIYTFFFFFSALRCRIDYTETDTRYESRMPGECMCVCVTGLAIHVMKFERFSFQSIRSLVFGFLKIEFHTCYIFFFGWLFSRRCCEPFIVIHRMENDLILWCREYNTCGRLNDDSVVLECHLQMPVVYIHLKHQCRRLATTKRLIKRL